MCGRYTLTTVPDEARIVLEEGQEAWLHARYNIAPTQYCPVVPQDDSTHIHYFRWGLIPHWANDMAIGNRMINARAETILEKPAFRQAVRHSRCLVLADGFYEWRKMEGGGKQPFRIRMKNEGLFTFAGISERWRSPEGTWINSFSIVTTEPNELMAQLHNRMPAILDREAGRQWLDERIDPLEAVSLLKPCEASLLEAYPVSSRVGNVRQDDAALIEQTGPSL